MDNEKNIQDFIEKYRDIDLDECNEPYTNWENRTSAYSVPPIMLRRYNKFLSKINIGLLVLIGIALIAILVLSVKLLLFTEFEVLVFSDGTDVTCIFNPLTGEMKQNDK